MALVHQMIDVKAKGVPHPDCIVEPSPLLPVLTGNIENCEQSLLTT
jgi:hypothetical protein